MSDRSGSSKRRKRTKGSSGEPLPSFSEGPLGDATTEAATTDFDRRVKALVEEILLSQEGAGPSTTSGSHGVVAEGDGKKPGNCSGTEEGVVQEEEEVMQEAEAVVQEEEGVVQEAEAVVQEEEGVMQEAEAVVQEEEGVMQEAEAVVQEEEGVVQEAEAVVQEAEAVVQEAEAVAPEEEGVMQEAEAVAPEGGTGRGSIGARSGSVGAGSRSSGAGRGRGNSRNGRGRRFGITNWRENRGRAELRKKMLSLHQINNKNCTTIKTTK